MKRFSIIAAAAACCLLSTACTSPSKSSSVAPGSSTPGSSTGNLPSSSTASSKTNGDVRVGLGFASTTSESNAANAEKAGNAKFNVEACALSIDADGKILDVKFDTLQANVGFDIKGALTGDVAAEVKTKKELGDAYNMKSASGIKKEWHEQIAALEDWMRGKTVDKVLAMKVTDRDTDKGIPDEADLKTSVTISVTDQLRALEKAYADAKR